MLVADALVSVVCPLAVSAETLVVARYELPETVRAVVDAFPKVADVADKEPTVADDAYKLVEVELVDDALVVIIVVKTPVVNVGLGVTPIVEVEEKTMLEPAMK
jgi:hypothetical protein